jgi:hypothetical protein
MGRYFDALCKTEEQLYTLIRFSIENGIGFTVEFIPANQPEMSEPEPEQEPEPEPPPGDINPRARSRRRSRRSRWEHRITE